MSDEQFPVDLWVMNVAEEENLVRVDEVVRALFDGRFQWNYGDIREEPKGCVRKLHVAEAEVAEKALKAVGASVLIDDGAYDEPGLWLSSISPEENRQAALATVEQYLDRQHRQWPGLQPGLLTVAFYVTDEGMVRRLMHKWDELPEYPMPAWPVWDDIV